jgi:hypothetical protein
VSHLRDRLIMALFTMELAAALVIAAVLLALHLMRHK